jgi:hypothetical protein
MIDDHMKVNEKLAELAHQRGITLPHELDKEAPRPPR